MSPDPSVLAVRVLTQQGRHLTALMMAAADLFEDPPADTPARADYDHIDTHALKSDLLGLGWWTYKSAFHNMSAAGAHMRGLRAILASNELLSLPAMAVGRCIYEAAISTFWLIDADATTELRLARWSGRLLHDTQEPPIALDSFGDADPALQERERVLEGRRLGQKLMKRAGFELKAKGGRKSDETRTVTYRGEVSGLMPNTTDLVARFTPNQRSLYPLFSGAIHSRGWLVEGLEGDAATVAASVLVPLLDTSDGFVIEVSRYFGIDPRPTLNKTHVHRQAVLQHARPSDSLVASWDAYRSAGGAPPLNS